MTEAREENDFTAYEALRAELANLQQQFERAAAHYHGLYHQLIHAPESTLPEAVWSAFIAENRAPVGRWEQWEVSPTLTACGRFHGEEAGLEEFLRLAESGYLILRAMKQLTVDGVAAPESFRLKLPSEDGHCGWLQLLYETAGCYATALLRTPPSFWRHPGPVAAEQIEDLVAQVRPATGDPTILVPVHPLTESLQHDLFQSSHEAIAIWIEQIGAVTLGDSICDTPVRLPEPMEDMLSTLLDDDDPEKTPVTTVPSPPSPQIGVQSLHSS